MQCLKQIEVEYNHMSRSILQCNLLYKADHKNHSSIKYFLYGQAIPGGDFFEG
jgi:hypothetical protein